MGIAVCMQVFNWSTTVRKVVVIAENTMSKSKTVLEMIVDGLDGHWEMMAPVRATDAQQLQRRCDPA